MSIPLSEAIAQIRKELRKAVLERGDEDIIFVPKQIELELSVTLETEAKGKAGVKLFVFVDTSAQARASRSSEHKVKLTLEVTDRELKPIKVVSMDETQR
jgi:hypothetical protein